MIYSTLITNGVKAIPANSYLALTITGATAHALECHINGTVTDFPLETNTTSQVAEDTKLACTFLVNANDTHAAASEIPALTVEAAFTTPEATDIYYLQPVTFDAVPVYSGSAMSFSKSEVVTDDNTTYYEGELYLNE